MNALVRRDHFDLAELFSPPDPETIGALLEEHSERWARIEQVSGMFGSAESRDCLRYFLEGNDDDRKYGVESLISKLFESGPALAALNAEYWDRMLQMTDVLDCMPQSARDKWNDEIRSRQVAVFNRANVAVTLREHLANRHTYFAQRVDGIFKALSPEHLTNSPSGFRKRMIINYVHSGWTIDDRRAGVINDLRGVIAKLMGRDEPSSWRSTRPVIRACIDRFTGDWVTVDGGALRIRVYKKGTAHLEVHPDIAWKLNAILARLHPTSIPAEHRRRPERKAKDIELFERPLPFAVVDVLAKIRGKHRESPRFVEHDYTFRDIDRHVRAEVDRVMESIGGAQEDGGVGRYRFDYDPAEVIARIVASGCVPDEKSHQYYPTPQLLAERVVDLAGIEPGHTVLEPSAGQGHLAENLPANLRTTCVEASALHCTVLRSKGFEVIEGDFLKLVPGRDFAPVDRVAMNPPFDRGQWTHHVEHAATFLASGGRLVAVLPASAPNIKVLPGWKLTWSEPVEFTGVSIKVVILVAERGDA